MSQVLGRLNVLATWLLGGVIASVLVVQAWPEVRALAGIGQDEAQWTWPKTLQVYPAYPGDPVRLVRITKNGTELVPGSYTMPQITGDDIFTVHDAVKEWAKDLSFTVKSRAAKKIVSVGIAVMVPVREIDIDCNSITGMKSAHEPWCDEHPHWCDGGCPLLIHNTLHWGRIPAPALRGLEVRYGAEAKGIFGDRIPLQGKEGLQVAPGEEITLSSAGRDDGVWIDMDPRKGARGAADGLVGAEGIEEAEGVEPCAERHGHSKTGCTFREVPKFNIGVDIVYFEDGTIWGNYGYGYALPNPDGIFTRVDERHFPGFVKPTSEPN